MTKKMLFAAMAVAVAAGAQPGRGAQGSASGGPRRKCPTATRTRMFLPLVPSLWYNWGHEERLHD